MLLTVALMVKNESTTIALTLLPLLEGGVQHFFIFDTGSTDDTVAVAKQLLSAHNVKYEIAQEPFVDFSISRNRALVLAEKAFPQVPFILMPDAEWRLQNVEGLLHFCEQQLSTFEPAFLVRIIMGSISFYTARLFRTSAMVRFVGVVHEVPSVAARIQVADDIYFDYTSSSYSREKSKQRWVRDAALLFKEYQANPKHPRTVFYLAQTYECLEQLKKAYKFYSIRVALEGWVEEHFIALFRLGNIATILSKTDKVFSWDMALQHYHRAFAICPHRIEPLVKIADHYWPSNPPICYLYARMACDLPFPSGNVLFVEKLFYDYTRFEILSRCAWYVGRYEQGLEATQRALAIYPQMPHLLNNLKLYKDKLASMATAVPA